MMRYAQSGHQKRETEIDEKRLEKVAAPETKRRLGVVAAAALLPLALAVVVTAFSDVARPSLERLQARVRPTPVVVAPPPAPVVVEAPPPPPAPPDLTEHDTLRAGEALSTALARHGIGAEDVSNLVRDVKDILAVRSLRAGAPYSVLKRDDGKLQRFTFKTTNSDGIPRTISAMRLAEPPVIEAPRNDDLVGATAMVATDPSDRSAKTIKADFDVIVEDAAVDVVVEGLAGEVRGSLYNGLIDAGGDAVLVNRFVDVFAWNIDFYRQTRAGDTFRVLVEKKYAGVGDDRRFLGFGKVVAAEYVNAGTALRGFAFESRDEKFSGVFDGEGGSLERTFLRNPMEVTRITSNFGTRFHPVLGRKKRHEGIDYGAPVGTPVWSVADGIVVEKRFSRSAGNMVVVQHINNIRTEYFHLSRFADIKAGARVKQKQLIGFVGSTGMSTGPHLHFGMRKSGAHVDPGKQKFPSAKPVPDAYLVEYRTFVEPLIAQLQALTRA